MNFTSYIRSVGAAVILTALLDILAPEGSFKKYCRAAWGFVVIAAMLGPLTGGLSFGSLKVPDTAAAQAQARARVLDEHRRNLEAAAAARFPGCRAYIDVDGEGNVTSLTVRGEADREAVMDYAAELGLEEDGVKINEGT